MRALVLAHGDGRRWDDDRGRPFLDRPKHFVQVDGVTLLERLVGQFVAHGAEVVVVGPDDRYQVPGATLAGLDGVNGCGSDMGKLLDTRHLWSTDGRTVIVWGDCFYTDELVADIVARDPGGYHVWRRPGRSEVTGARWDESFAVSFGPADHDRVIAAAELVAGMVRSGELRSSHIRTHMVAMAGHRSPADLGSVTVAAACPDQTHVDDWSDDFDTPKEWSTWMRRRFDHDGHRVGVCIPWQDADTWRAESFRWSLDWWHRHQVEVFVGSDRTGGEHPNRSAMRNDAARQAVAAGCDVLFFADSDTFVAADQLWAAVCLAWHHGQMVLAYDRYVRVNRQTTVRMMRRGLDLNARTVAHLSRRAYTSSAHISGALAIPASLFEELGGFDERFTRWGYEDRAFHLAAVTVAGEAPRVRGDAFHWWHPTAADKDRKAPDSIEAARLARRYYLAAAWVPTAGAVLAAVELGLVDPLDLPVDAVPDVEAMRALLAEPGGPLAQPALIGGR